MKMFSPFPQTGADKAKPAEETTRESTLDELRLRINTLQQQVEQLSEKTKE
jgi:polyhydroxyalkanoate synthesis regulator phasin